VHLFEETKMMNSYAPKKKNSKVGRIGLPVINGPWTELLDTIEIDSKLCEIP